MSGLGQPSEAQIKRALQIIDASENAPVFIHCQRGSDRTGVIVAVYRMSRDGWTADQALDEANRFGMGFIQFQKREYIKDYFSNLQRAGHSAGGEKAAQEIR
jgi:protein tyrosine/serine phosphatase